MRPLRLLALLAAAVLARPALASHRKTHPKHHRRTHHARRTKKAPKVAEAPAPPPPKEDWNPDSGHRHPITHSIATPDDDATR